MITIEPADGMPDLPWSKRAREETTFGVGPVVRDSLAVWKVSEKGVPLFLCGVYQPMLLTPPEFWMLTCEHFVEEPLRMVRTARGLLEQLLAKYPNVIARALVDDFQSRRMITICGLRETARTETYVVYGA